MVRATLAVLGVALSFALVYRFYAVLLGFAIAVVLATGLMPMVDWLERRGARRTIGTSAVFAGLAVIVAVVSRIGLPFIFERVRQFAAGIPNYYQALRGLLTGSSSSVLRHVVLTMPEQLATSLPGDGSMNVLASTAGTVSETLLMIVSVLTLSFYWMVDGPRATRVLLLWAPKLQRRELSSFATIGQARLGAFVRGQLFVCTTVGGMALVAYAIIGLPDLIVLALLAALLEAVPMIGPLLGAVPAVLVALTISPTRALWVVVAAVVIHLFENFVLVPRVMKRAVGVHPALCLVAVAGMSSLLGPFGALLAIPTAALVQLAIDRLIQRRSDARDRLAGALARRAAVRAEVMALIRDREAA